MTAELAVWVGLRSTATALYHTEQACTWLRRITAPLPTLQSAAERAGLVECYVCCQLRRNRALLTAPAVRFA